MEQLDLLWNLEIHHNSLKNFQKELFNLGKVFSTDEVEKKIINTEDKLIKFKSKQEVIKNKLIESNRRLKDYDYKVKEVEINLYNGNTKDIKQLEHLSQEKDNLKEIINETENEILESMDEVEKIDKELLLMNKDIEDIKSKNKKSKRKHKTLVDELNKKILSEKKEIESLEEKVDKALLKQYNLIRNNRGTGIAEVKNSVCSGCNLMIPTFMDDKLNDKSEIIYCESCGRILCKQ